MEIFGRERELARLDFFLESLPSGSGAFLLEGEPGIGKTTVWRAGVEAAEARGFRVLSSRPGESDSSLTYAGLADLLDGIEDGVFAALPEPQLEALDVALLRRAAAERPPDPRAVFAALHTILAKLASSAPTLVAVDDVQWLDGPSARALEFVGRRLDATRVGLLASSRLEAGHTAATWFERNEIFRLEPLSAAALHELVKRRLGWSMPRPTVLRVHTACTGNAFFALELARALDYAGRPDPRDSWPIPDDVRQLVGLRLRRLPSSVRGTLLRAAAVSRPTMDLLDAAALRTAEEAGVLSAGPASRVRFAHPLYASAIYESTRLVERREVHAELAATERDPEERARHLGLATADPDERVAAALDQAAERARSRGAPEVAADLQERALELTPASDDPSLQRRALAAAKDCARAGAPVRARRLLERPVASADRTLRVSALRLLAQICYRERSVTEAARLMTDAADVAGDDPVLRAPIELELAYSCVTLSFDFEGAGPHAALALEHAERTGNRQLISQALAVRTMAEFLLGRGLDVAGIDRALALEDLDDDVQIELRPTLIAGCLALYVGDYERARSFLYPLRVRLRERGEDAELPHLIQAIVWVECSAGDLATARKLVDEGLDAAAVTAGESMVVVLSAAKALVEAHSGRVEPCRRLVAAALEGVERTGYGIAAYWALWAAGLLEVAREQWSDVLRSLAPLIEQVEADGISDPIRVGFLPDAVEALVAVGELQRAETLIEQLDARGRALDRPWARATSERCRALLLAARGEVDAADDAAERALVEHERMAMPLELARTLIVAGRIARRRRQRARARISLERALAICDEMGAALWAERARAELARLGSRGDPAALTATEERVAELAASGLTNREVAAAAFMSQKTVEANLSRAYRKLGIRSRAELGLRLAERENARAPLA